MPDLHETINQFLEGSIASIGRDPVIESKSITANGTYSAPEGVDGYSPITVNVPIPTPVIESKSITANGTYSAPEGVDGYSPVQVNVEPVIESKTITENGTYTPEIGVDGFAPVVVNVQSSAPVIESKNITENGTYTAPEGVDGYSPITVNVPLPQNAYLLKSVANLPQAIATFNDGADAPMKSLKVAIEPIQEGSGDPSPTNVRPISGWDEVDITVADDDTDPTVSNVYTIDLDGTRYGGEVDLVSGSGTDTIKAFEVDEASDIEMLTSHIFRINKSKYPDGKFNGDSIEGLLCEKFKPQISDMPNNICYSTTNGLIIRTIDAYANTSEFFNAIGSFKFTYPLATPLTIQLTPTAVKSLLGVNNVYANTGDITDAKYFSKEG